MGKKRGESTNGLLGWLWRRSMKVKILLGVTIALCCQVVLNLLIQDRTMYFFIASESVHAVGILVLIYKLIKHKTCSGLSLKSQELTAIFLAGRWVLSFMIESDIHTVLDFITLIATLWVIYMMRFKLKSTYIKELDSMPLYYLVVPCAILAVLINPYTPHTKLFRISWAFFAYLESVSVVPQLRMMQKAKMIEPFTGHYVFALGVARFLSFSHWIIQLYLTRGRYLFVYNAGSYWFPVALLAEVVQSFILVDFCYYYIKSVMDGQLVVRVPV